MGDAISRLQALASMDLAVIKVVTEDVREVLREVERLRAEVAGERARVDTVVGELGCRCNDYYDSDPCTTCIIRAAVNSDAKNVREAVLEAMRRATGSGEPHAQSTAASVAIIGGLWTLEWAIRELDS